MFRMLQNLTAYSLARDALRAGKAPLLLDGAAAIHKAPPYRCPLQRSGQGCGGTDRR